jgi:recombination protein RecT
MTTELITRPATKRTPSKTERRKKSSPSAKVSPIESARRALELMKPQLATVLPEHLTADRLVRLVIAALQGTPALLDCDRASLYRAVMTCAQLGLEPDGVLGQAWLAPSQGKVQLVPGYQGLIALARNSGQIPSINAQAVYRNDHFDYAYGLNERLEHVPGGGDRGEITHFYAYAKLKDGGHCFDVMSRGEVDAARDRGESYQAYLVGRSEGSPWVNGYAEMGKAAVLRRIARSLPLPVRKAAALADLYEAGKTASLDNLGEILIDPAVDTESPRAEEPQPPPPSRLDAVATLDMPQPDRAPRFEPVPAGEPEGLDLSEEELAALLPPLHILEILDAVAEREMPEETLESIIGKPLDEVVEGDTREILRAITLWQPDGR